MICVLYKSCLVLATTNRVFTPYNIVAVIALANGTVEEPDNGRGTYIKFYLFQAIDKIQDFSAIPLNTRGNLSSNQVIDCSKSYYAPVPQQRKNNGQNTYVIVSPRRLTI